MKHLIIGTAGHVDHGKTTLVRALTGIDCDTHKEEKERGITINLGFAHIDLPSGQSFGIVDVPGHKDFIRTMVAGAYGIDMFLLVIAADSGVMPQTAEHIKIIRMLGVKHGVVALTKTDLVDEEIMELVQMEIAEFLEESGIGDAPIIGVSAVTGKGLEELKSAIATSSLKVKEKELRANFRMYIDRLFNVKGLGYVATGSVLEGEISAGKDVFLLPGNAGKFKIRSIERHGEPVETVFAGDRAALNLAGIKNDEYERGMVLTGMEIPETSMIDATFTLFEPGITLKLWSNVIFYSGTFECTARMHLLTNDKLKTGENVVVQIHLGRPAILMNKDKYILRNSSGDHTLGGGTIIDIHPLHHRRRNTELSRNLEDLALSVEGNLELLKVIHLALKKEQLPVFSSEIALKTELDEAKIIAGLEQNQGEEVVMFSNKQNHILLSRTIFEEYRKKTVDEVSLWNKKNPLVEEGPDILELSGKLGFTGKEAARLCLEEMLKQLTVDGVLRQVADTWSLADHKIKIDVRTQEQLVWLENQIRNAGMELPDMNRIEEKSKDLKIQKDRLKMMLQYLGRQNKIAYYDNEYIHRSNLDECRKILLSDLIKKERGINEKDFRLLLNTTKRMVQVLEGIFLEEGYIAKRSFYIDITEKGKEELKKM